MRHVMIDIETLGNISIGAVVFDIETAETKEEFYCVIDIDSCIREGLKVTGYTIKWWLMQNEKARIEVAKNGIDLRMALHTFAQWLQEGDILWSNGVRFDIGIMEDAYKALGLEVPWNFRNERDVRTLVSFAPEIKERHDHERTDIPHHPIDDCKTQILYCSEIYNKIIKK